MRKGILLLTKRVPREAPEGDIIEGVTHEIQVLRPIGQVQWEYVQIVHVVLVGIYLGADDEFGVEFGVGPLGDGLVVVGFDLHLV